MGIVLKGRKVGVVPSASAEGLRSKGEAPGLDPSVTLQSPSSRSNCSCNGFVTAPCGAPNRFPTGRGELAFNGRF